jgi:hypothetical protein
MMKIDHSFAGTGPRTKRAVDASERWLRPIAAVSIRSCSENANADSAARVAKSQPAQSRE